MTEVVRFCEGCPLANGVEGADTCYTTQFVLADPNPGFDITFGNAHDPDHTTLPIHAVVDDDVDSSMPEATVRVVKEEVNGCERPVEVRAKRLGGLAGTKTVVRCGAYPDQNPKRVQVLAEDSGWFYPADFL
ncbi:MAG TPA: hypothetical protein VLF69_01910 [Candidatus Saccharimonadales bacterium]|nr:hypothetical protein [Candidatus Saccharimonadales bacterium]